MPASVQDFEPSAATIGNIPIAVKDSAFGTFVVSYLTPELGLSGTLAGRVA
ncbi:MAG: hypothetical protein O7F73_07265 [Gammaproteobacteria bacterium]|nr:hypothetical protein [Gammaproteobacteria bacterium]